MKLNDIIQSYNNAFNLSDGWIVAKETITSNKIPIFKTHKIELYLHSRINGKNILLDTVEITDKCPTGNEEILKLKGYKALLECLFLRSKNNSQI